VCVCACVCVCVCVYVCVCVCEHQHPHIIIQSIAENAKAWGMSEKKTVDIVPRRSTSHIMHSRCARHAYCIA